MKLLTIMLAIALVITVVAVGVAVYKLVGDLQSRPSELPELPELPTALPAEPSPTPALEPTPTPTTTSKPAASPSLTLTPEPAPTPGPTKLPEVTPMPQTTPSSIPTPSPVDFSLNFQEVGPRAGPRFSLSGISYTTSVQGVVRNNGAEEAHDVEIVVSATAGSAHVSLNNQDPLVVPLGDIAGGGEIGETLEITLRIPLTAATTAQRSGLDFSLSVRSREKVQQFETYHLSP